MVGDLTSSDRNTGLTSPLPTEIRHEGFECLTRLREMKYCLHHISALLHFGAHRNKIVLLRDDLFHHVFERIFHLNLTGLISILTLVRRA